jgi:hypothetical protein
MMAKICLVICLMTRVFFNENMFCVMFVICLLDIMWRVRVTGNGCHL